MRVTESVPSVLPDFAGTQGVGVGGGVANGHVAVPFWVISTALEWLFLKMIVSPVVPLNESLQTATSFAGIFVTPILS